MSNAQDVYDFLQECGVFYLTTVDGDKPACRPVSFHMVVDDVEYFGVGKHKAVYRQLIENPNVEIIGVKGSDWVRIKGTVSFGDDPALFAKAVEAMPFLADLYNEETGNELGIFSLKGVTAEFIEQMMTVTKMLEF